MIHRETDPATVNSVARKSFPGIDLAEFLAEPMHVCLVDGDSGAMFAWRGPGAYEVHVFFSVRGRAALDLGHAMLDYMRERGAERFWALVPENDRKVRMFTRLMGWKSEGLVATRNGENELFLLENEPCLQS
jgi:hypothetical protein